MALLTLDLQLMCSLRGMRTTVEINILKADAEVVLMWRDRVHVPQVRLSRYKENSSALDSDDRGKAGRRLEGVVLRSPRPKLAWSLGVESRRRTLPDWGRLALVVSSDCVNESPAMVLLLPASSLGPPLLLPEDGDYVDYRLIHGIAVWAEHGQVRQRPD